MAPVIAKRLSRLIALDETSDEIEAWNLERFQSGRLLEGGMIIG